jgi:hypothetical protein
MGHDDQKMMLFRQSEEACANDGTMAEIEAPRLYIHQLAVQLGSPLRLWQRGQIDQRHVKREVLMNDLVFAIGIDCGAQSFMSIHEVLEGSLKQIDIQRASHLKRGGFRVGSVGTREHLGQQP